MILRSALVGRRGLIASSPVEVQKGAVLRSRGVASSKVPVGDFNGLCQAVLRLASTSKPDESRVPRTARLQLTV